MRRGYRYDAFGGTTEESGTLENPYMFTGRESETTTGLYYYRARWYDPSVGRFLSKDPAGFGGGPNLYAYAGNNPVRFVDPSGRGGVGLRGVRVDAGGHLRGGGAGTTSPVWTMECTAMSVFFLTIVALTLLGLGIPRADMVLQIGYRALGPWNWGLSGAAIFGSVHFLINTILSIAWFLIFNVLPWWKAAVAGATLTAKTASGVGLALTGVLIGVQLVIHLAGLQAKGCIRIL